MSDQINSTEQETAKYIESIAERRREPGLRGAGRIGPEYWADAPWRLEPAQEKIPLTFIARDAEDEQIHQIRVYQVNGASEVLLAEVPGPGKVGKKYWSYQPLLTIPRPPGFVPDPTWPSPGKHLKLRVEFVKGRNKIYDQHLQILVAKEALPLRASAQWYYGDTHYHSSYTNDLKEFGNPIPDTREAARCIGLEWMIVTDHSVDLQDSNPYWEGRAPDSRWDDEGREVAQHSNDEFRMLRGEEVSVMGKRGAGNDTLHLLVFGENFEKFIPGAFMNVKWLETVLNACKASIQETKWLTCLCGKIHPLPGVLTGQDQQATMISELAGRSVQAQQALAFAAHPTYNAQGRHGTWEDDDLDQPIHGMEAWNTRIRYNARAEAHPFGSWKFMSEAPPKEDAAIARWDEMLRRRLDREDPRFFMLAGSDAHGSFNYGVAMGLNIDIKHLDFDPYRAEDNCLGKVRTALYLPHRGANGDAKAPSVSEIITAIREGSCVVTDGPVLNLTAHFNGREAKLGELMDGLSGDGALEVKMQACSTKEFGEIKQVKVVYYFKGMSTTEKATMDFQTGSSSVIKENLPAAPGYVRLETETHNGHETFRCVTNPIWIRFGDGGKRSLKVTCADW